MVRTSVVGLSLMALMCVLLLSSAAWAQLSPSSIAGVVKDTSGAVLPGVTVEAASPALIEKVRTAVTDREGALQHRRPAARHLYRQLQSGQLQPSSGKGSS